MRSGYADCDSLSFPLPSSPFLLLFSSFSFLPPMLFKSLPFSSVEEEDRRQTGTLRASTALSPFLFSFPFSYILLLHRSFLWEMNREARARALLSSLLLFFLCYFLPLLALISIPKKREDGHAVVALEGPPPFLFFFSSLFLPLLFRSSFFVFGERETRGRGRGRGGPIHNPPLLFFFFFFFFSYSFARESGLEKRERLEKNSGSSHSFLVSPLLLCAIFPRKVKKITDDAVLYPPPSSFFFFPFFFFSHSFT